MRDLAKKRKSALDFYYANREERLIYDRAYHAAHREERAAKKRRTRQIEKSLRSSWLKINDIGDLFPFTLGQLENPLFVFECRGRRTYDKLNEPLPTWKKPKRKRGPSKGQSPQPAYRAA